MQGVIKINMEDKHVDKEIGNIRESSIIVVMGKMRDREPKSSKLVLKGYELEI
jgi:hypothetical protein